MSALKEIVKAHIKAARVYQELVELERAGGLGDAEAKKHAELVTTCQFYAAVERILEELECEP